MIGTGGSSARTMRGKRRKATRASRPVTVAQTTIGGGDRRATASAGTSSANRPAPSLRPLTTIGGAPSPGSVKEAYHSSAPTRRPSSGGSPSASQTSACATGRPDSSTTTPLTGIGPGSGEAGSWPSAEVIRSKVQAAAFMRCGSLPATGPSGGPCRWTSSAAFSWVSSPRGVVLLEKALECHRQWRKASFIGGFWPMGRPPIPRSRVNDKCQGSGSGREGQGGVEGRPEGLYEESTPDARSGGRSASDRTGFPGSVLTARPIRNKSKYIFTTETQRSQRRILRSCPARQSCAPSKNPKVSSTEHPTNCWARVSGHPKGRRTRARPKVSRSTFSARVAVAVIVGRPLVLVICIDSPRSGLWRGSVRSGRVLVSSGWSARLPLH